MVESKQTEKSIFLAAVEIDADEERAAFIEGACAGNPQLRAEVEALLQAHARPQPLLDTAATSDSADDPPMSELLGAVIGPYKLIELIGEGGMGTVWMAQQTEPVKRLVALKLIKAGMDSKHVIARFEAERQALALMDHANIARVLDAGTTDAGRPYFVMDLVKGIPITKYCDEHHITPRQRLELFMPVCQAVQHAHQKGIIHRDLKPSNVLVALYDGKPVPKIIDFGVAKATGHPLTDKTLVTGFGAIVGTLEYMSPEQAEINQLDIDTRSDIYSLGVLLYELLTGSPPFSRKDLEKAGMLEMLRVIREQEPSKPSTKLSTAEGLPTLAANRGTEPAKLTKLVRGELDWIVMKALEKDRNRRYETANGFAMDVQRYLADEPVHACPPSVGYRVRKFVRRNKGPVLAASLLMLALVGGTTGTTLGLIWATQAEGEARAESIEKSDALQLKEEALILLRQQQERTKAALLQVRREAAYLTFEQAYRKCEQEGVDQGMLALVHSLRKAQEADLPDLEQSIRAQLGGWVRPLYPQRSVVPVPGGVRALAVSPDGKTVVTAHIGGVCGAQFWEAKTGEPLGPPFQPGEFIHAVAFSPDGKTVLTGSGGRVTAQLWEAPTGKPVGPPLGHRERVLSVAFSPDGKTLLTGSFDKTARLWEAATGMPVGPPLVHQDAVNAVAFSPDGSTFLTSAGNCAQLRDVGTGKPVGLPLQHEGEIRAVAFSPDGRTVLTVTGTTVQIWDVDTGKPLKRPLTHPGPCFAAAFSPDGKTILTAGTSVQLWDVETLMPLGPDLKREDSVLRAIFSPDGRSILVGTVNSWWRWELGGPTSLAMSFDHGKLVRAAAFSPDGQKVLTGGEDTTAQLWETATGKPLGVRLVHQAAVRAVAFSPDGKTILTGSLDRTARLWEAATGKPLGPPLLHPQAVNAVAFSPDGKTILTGSFDKTARLWEAATGTPLWSLLLHQESVRAVAFSPDGKTILTGSDDKTARLWETTNGKPIGPPLLHQDKVLAVAFSPDGKTILTGSVDRTTRLWNAATGEPLGTPLQHQCLVKAVAFSPDGKTLLIANRGLSSSARPLLWQVATDKPIGPPLRHGLEAFAVAFSPDGKSVLTGGRGPAMLWNVGPVAGDVERIALWVQVLTGKELDDKGVAQFLDFKTREHRREQLQRLGGPPWP